MLVRTPKSTCNGQIQRKRAASGDPIDEQVYKYLKHTSKADCISTGPLDRQIDVPSQEHHKGSGRSKSAPSVNRRRNQDKEFDRPFLHTASEQGDISLVDGGDKLAQARGGCTKTQKSSKDPDTPDVVVGLLTERALYQLNKLNRPLFSKASSSMTSAASSALPGSSVLEATKGTIGPDHHKYGRTLECRGMYLADEGDDEWPSNFNELKETLKEERKDFVPNDADARQLRNLIKNVNNEAAVVQSILPEIVPNKAIGRDGKTCMVPDQYWDRKIMVEPNAKPALTPPKPDRTIGWLQKVFDYPIAITHLDTYACPVAGQPSLAFPLFTVEVTGDRGSLKCARLQNLHNGATMLSNLWRIRQFYDKEKEGEFFNNVHALSLQLTAETIQVSCYWATRNGNGKIRFYGTEVRTWTLYEGDQYKEACRYTLNAMDWVRNQASGWIHSALARLEASLDTTIPTPPPTQSNRGNAKRTRSSTSESSSANSPSKKPGSEKMRESLSAGDKEAGLEIGTSEDIPASEVGQW